MLYSLDLLAAPKSNYGISTTFGRIQYCFQTVTTHKQSVTSVRFYVYALARQTVIQECICIESSHPYELIDDAFTKTIEAPVSFFLGCGSPIADTASPKI